MEINKKDKGLVLDWLNEIIDNPEEWKRFYSDSEVKLLAEKAKELGIPILTEQEFLALLA